MRSAFLVLVMALFLPLYAVAQEPASVTLVDGNLRVIRGTAVLSAPAGVRLRQGDILETSENAFVQVEFAGGPVVALGPSTRLFLFSVHNGQGHLVLLSGWMKAEGINSTGAFQYSTQLLSASTRNGTVIVHADARSTDLYVESGSATIVGSNAQGHRGTATEAKAGQYFSREEHGATTTKPRPDAAFVTAMPRPFKDTLPPRASRFAARGAEPKFDHEVSYSEIQPWLSIPRAWRQGFVQRFKPRLSDAAFRKGLEANLAAHPEWDPVLHPEKYRPKPDAPPPEKPGPQDRSNLP